MAPKASSGERTCTLCGLTKPLGEFHRRREGHQNWCKACRSSYDAAYYLETRELRIQQRRARYRRLIEWMREVKTSQPCVDCGGWFHPAAMSFDHLPGTEKRGDVSTLVRSGYKNVALAEILKCDIVCANCHAVRTYMRMHGLDEAPAPYSVPLTG